MNLNKRKVKIGHLDNFCKIYCHPITFDVGLNILYDIQLRTRFNSYITIHAIKKEIANVNYQTQAK